MKKPWWLRVFGWGVLLAWIWEIGFLLLGAVNKAAAPIAGFSLLFIWFIVAATGFWMLLSALIWVANRQVRAQAAVIRDAVHSANGSSELGSNPSRLPVELPLAETGIVCEVCSKSHAVVHCCRHEKTLCWRCAVYLDNAECAYVLANRYTKPTAPRERQRTVATSPLSGAR